MKLHKRDIGRYYLVRFDDYSENVGAIVACEAVGRLTVYDRKSVTLRSWDTPGIGEQSNWTILRRAVREWVELCPVQAASTCLQNVENSKGATDG